MKNMKKIVGLLVAIILIAGCFATLFPSHVQAVNYVPSEKIKAPASDVYEFNASEYMEIVALRANAETRETYFANRIDLESAGNTAIPIRQYNDNDELSFTRVEDDGFANGKLSTVDCSFILEFAFGVDSSLNTSTTANSRSSTWSNKVNSIICSIVAAEEGVSKDDISVTVTVTTPQIVIDDLTITRKQYQINTETLVTQEVMNGIYAARQDNIDVYTKMTGNALPDDSDMAVQQIVTLTATTDSATYRMALGDDDSWYLIKELKSPLEPDIPIVDDTEFDTDLEYSATVTDATGTLKNGTFIPPYTENDINKKDSDVIATISSKTNEGISVTNDVIVKTDRTANTEGWYYSSEDNIKSINKKYLFDDYDNTTYNGIVTETVKVIGNDDGRDTQNVSIKWKFRRKTKTEKENDDKSITVTIVYNLPVDKDSIPDGWTPVYDDDGETIHAIKMTIKKDEDYDKDVIVKQNGTDETVTTKVTKTWDKEDYTGKKDEPTVLPQTGAFTAVIVVIMIGFTGFAITRYRKINK